MQPAYIARGQKIRCDSGTFIIRVRSFVRIRPRLDGKRVVRHNRNSATARHSELCPPAELKHRSPFEILAAEDTAGHIQNVATGEPIYLREDGVTVDTRALAKQSQQFVPEDSSPKFKTADEHSAAVPCRETVSSVSALPVQPLYCTRCGDTIRDTTSSPPSTEATIVPRRRFQKGRVFQRNKIKKWAGSFRDEVIDPRTGKLKRVRRTVTFDSSVTSRRAALRALQPYLDRVNVDPPSPKRGGKTVGELVEEWKKEIIPNRKPGGARASLSHLRKYIVPLLGKMTLREVNPKTIQTFVTTVGVRVDRKKTVENVYGTLSSILRKGRRWGYFIPDVKREDIEFPANKKPPTQTFIFDADTGALVINAAEMPFRYMLLVDALCYLRIGEGDALKVPDLDFARKVVNVNAALDYATGKEGATKTDKSCTSIPMPEMLERYLKDWLENHYKPNPEGYLFINRKGKPYRSENVVRQGVHKAMAKLGIPRPKGVHVGVHCFRHGASSELLDFGTPINVVTRLMRHSDAKTTLKNYAHLVHDSDRAASERLSKKIEQKLVQLESTPEMESTSIKPV